MPFPTAQLLEIARHYEARIAEPRYGALYATCAAGLLAWEARRAFYRKNIDTARRFLGELEKRVARACDGGLPDAETEQETAFALLECLACIIREVTLSAGAGTPEEESVLAYFETCGEWRPDDANLVSEYYFKRIPAAVLCRAAAVLDAGIHPVTATGNPAAPR